ncbi:hypothetical protein [Streptomyces sp. NPDC056160]|uniref:hypothetical protein n=1 Tax=Streptomyces sp. NPDC056160 TaxID=3345731 RepID=UPI0035D5F115
MPNTATPEQAAATVRERVAAGADFVKSAAMARERFCDHIAVRAYRVVRSAR